MPSRAALRPALRRCALPFACLAAAVWLAATPARAQTQAEIDTALSQLSEILGALAHLETLCPGDGRQQSSIGGLGGEAPPPRSREDMQRLLASEELTPLRQSILVDAYNRGFRAVASTHRRCTAASTRLIALHHERGAAIVQDLLGAAANRPVEETAEDEAGDTPAERPLPDPDAVGQPGE